VHKPITIEDVNQAILILQQYGGKIEGGKSSGRKIITLGDPDFFLWNDQVIMATFGICSKTVARNRERLIFKGFKVGGIFYYYRDDILPLRNGFLR